MYYRKQFLICLYNEFCVGNFIYLLKIVQRKNKIIVFMYLNAGWKIFCAKNV